MKRTKPNSNTNTEETNVLQDTELEVIIPSNKMYTVFVYIGNKTINIIYIFLSVSGTYLLWILLHYIASHLYVRFCTPVSIIGFIISPFLTATPQCQGLRWVIYNGANMINNMWVIIGTWVCSTLLIVNNNVLPYSK